MRLRIQRKIRKALRIFGIRGIEPAGLPALVRDRTADSRRRVLAAQLLALDKRQRDPFAPLYAQMLDCDGMAALDLSNSLHLRQPKRRQFEIAPFVEVLRTSPDEVLRIAIVQLLGGMRDRSSRRLLIETMERESESLSVRTTAADTLSYQRPRRDTVDAYRRCLRHANPSVRFWAVFGLGSSSSDYPAYHDLVVSALRPLVNDADDEPGYWRVGDEARAMLAHVDPEIREEVRLECEAIHADPDANPGKQRWAECYYWRPDAETMPVPPRVQYQGIDWFLR